MSLGLFGTIVLDKIDTVSMDGDYTTEYAEHARFGAKPLLQGVGDNLIDKRLHFELHIDNGDPQTRLDSLQTMRSNRQAGELVIGGRLHGWFVITQLTVTHKWLSDDGKPLWLSVAMALKEYVGNTDKKPNAVAVATGSEPINSQAVSPALQLNSVNPTLQNLAQTVTALMQSQSQAVLLEQQAMMAEGVSEGAIGYLTKDLGSSMAGFVGISQSVVDRLSNQSLLDNLTMADCQSLVAQAKAVKGLFDKPITAQDIPIVLGQVKSVATMGKALFGDVTAKIAKNNVMLMLR